MRRGRHNSRTREGNALSRNTDEKRYKHYRDLQDHLNGKMHSLRAHFNRQYGGGKREREMCPYGCGLSFSGYPSFSVQLLINLQTWKHRPTCPIGYKADRSNGGQKFVPIGADHCGHRANNPFQLQISQPFQGI